MILLERVIHNHLKETLYIERECNCIKDVIAALDEVMDENNIGVLKTGWFVERECMSLEEIKHIKRKTTRYGYPLPHLSL